MTDQQRPDAATSTTDRDRDADRDRDPERAPSETPTPPAPTPRRQPAGERGGPKGPEPTRYGDWEKNGRCFDF